jgi:hypothetical protein
MTRIGKRDMSIRERKTLNVKTRTPIWDVIPGSMSLDKKTGLDITQEKLD